MTVKYHITKSGEPGVCRATKRACPLGGEAEHYSSKEEARLAYESQNFSKLLAKQTHSPSEVLEKLSLQLEALASTATSSTTLAIYEQAIAAIQDVSDTKLNRIQELYRSRSYRAHLVGLDEVAEASYRVNQSIVELRASARSRAIYEQRLKVSLDPNYIISRMDELEANTLHRLEKLRQTAALYKSFDVEPIYDDKKPVSFVAPKDRELWRALGGAHELYVGKLTEEARAKAYERLENHAYELAETLESLHAGGEVPAVFYGGQEYGKLAGAEDFELIAGGAEANVYLHRPSMMVFKVRHDEAEASSPEAKSRADAQRVAVLTVEQAYGKFDREGLSQLDADYIKTYFIHPKNGVPPMIVQPYLDPKRYEPYDPSPEETKEFKRLGFSDTHNGNLSIDTVTGRVVLFDCIYADAKYRP